MFNEDTGVYTIGTVAGLLGEHPETLRVWERNSLITPDRRGYQRKYTNNDLKRLKFIKHLMDEKGLNIAGAKQIISMYPCWYKKDCKGGAKKDGVILVNEYKPCWKEEKTYCLVVSDKSEICSTCDIFRICIDCNECIKNKTELRNI